jgi:hypothetical protein
MIPAGRINKVMTIHITGAKTLIRSPLPYLLIPVVYTFAFNYTGCAPKIRYTVKRNSFLPVVTDFYRGPLTELHGFLYFMPMNSVLRSVTFILLLLALSTLTGVAQTASAFVAQEASLQCCPHETSSDETPSDLPDCSLDCHCSSCQGVDVSYRLLLLNTSLETVLSHPAPLSFFPAGHQQSIEYPPETT